MDLVYRLERATVAQVHEQLADAPTYNAVRALMNVLVDKGHLEHSREGRRYVYAPTVPAEEASASALQRVVRSFFQGSTAKAAVALLALDDAPDPEELAELEEALRQAREEGR